jgi:hypothetical protein
VWLRIASEGALTHTLAVVAVEVVAVEVVVVVPALSACFSWDLMLTAGSGWRVASGRVMPM